LSCSRCYEASFSSIFGLPALDARSRELVFLTLKLSPETTLRGKPTGKPSIPPVSNRKRWLAANFRLGFDVDTSLSNACRRVSKIDAISVKQVFNGHELGESRDPIKRAHLEISNLVITLPEAFAEPFYAWHQSFVIDGVNSDKDEKSVTLEYLAQDLKETLFTLKLLNVGIISVTPVPAGSYQLSQVKVEMYCEQLSFN